MTPELHPEEALDLAIAGELPDAEWRVLDRHLAVCKACKGHLALARTSKQTRSPQPWDDRSNRQAIDHALAQFARPRWLLPSFALGRSRWLLVTAGMILAVGGMASAAWWYRQVPSSEEGMGLRPQPSRVALVPARSRMAAAAILAETVPSELPGPAEEGRMPSRTARVQPSATSLFEQASALRARNKLDDAILVFRRLQQQFPRSRESRLSFALAGRMLLDRGRPAQALAQFDQHLAQGGEASEEALAGRATALGQMGRLPAERETWQKLVSSYPRSVYASQARDRIFQLRRSEEVFPAGDPSR